MNNISPEQLRHNLVSIMLSQGNSAVQIVQELPKLMAIIYNDSQPELKATGVTSEGQSPSPESLPNPLFPPFTAHYFTAHQGVQGSSMDATGTARVSYGDAHPLNRVMICILVLENGFIVTGAATGLSEDEALALNAVSESEEQLRKRAFQNAIQELSGYEIYYNFELWKRQGAVAIQE